VEMHPDGGIPASRVSAFKIVARCDGLWWRARFGTKLR